MQSSPNPMEVLFNNHLNLIKATETVSVPQPFNIQQHEVESLLVCLLRYGLQGPKFSSLFSIRSILTHITQLWEYINTCYIQFNESWPSPVVLKVFTALQAHVWTIPEEGQDSFLQQASSSAF
jgi:hypothetical protein